MTKTNAESNTVVLVNSRSVEVYDGIWNDVILIYLCQSRLTMSVIPVSKSIVRMLRSAVLTMRCFCCHRCLDEHTRVSALLSHMLTGSELCVSLLKKSKSFAVSERDVVLTGKDEIGREVQMVRRFMRPSLLYMRLRLKCLSETCNCEPCFCASWTSVSLAFPQ